MMAGELDVIEYEAARWVDRMNSPVLDSADAADFDRWILADPRHCDSYARLSAIWQSGGLSQGLSRRLAEGGEDGHARFEVDEAPSDVTWDLPSYPRMAGLLAVAACVLLFCTFMPPLIVQEASFSSPRGVTREVALADGSRVRLDGDTRIDVRITPWSRRVDLARGEAFFDVAHEQWRSFTVEMGAARVSVLGTAFDVDRVDASTQVIQVYRGLVSVEAGKGREWRLPAGTGLELAGQRVRSLRDVEGNRPAWTDGWYEANDTPIFQLVQHVNRNASRPIVLADPGLGELRVTGRFRTAQPEDVLEAISALHDLHWQKMADRYVVSR
ncbi:FecR domain-containing protein [Novosphingobium sp. BL-8A]|uniref:FecR family protein n=1 Tax=Novosphingobium sp. BL-8A TaxID=3127639 RepID=UPI003757983D